MSDFNELTSDVIAKQHFIACADGPYHFRIIKDRINNSGFGVRIPSKTLHWFLNNLETDTPK
jgi:hypothetical protein